MSETQFTIELPDEVLALLGSREQAAERAREALVLELVREASISHGKAAELLGLSRSAMLDLLVRYQIEMGPATGDEMRADLVAARRASRPARAGDHQ